MTIKPTPNSTTQEQIDAIWAALLTTTDEKAKTALRSAIITLTRVRDFYDQ